MLTMVRYEPDLSALVHVGYLYKHVALDTNLGNRIIDIRTEPLSFHISLPPVIPF